MLSAIGWEKPQITPGNLLELAVHGRDELFFVLMKGRPPLFLGLQVDEVFGIEEAGRVGPVIRTPRLTGALGNFGKGAKQMPGLIR